jgi:hypothetical protein
VSNEGAKGDWEVLWRIQRPVACCGSGNLPLNEDSPMLNPMLLARLPQFTLLLSKFLPQATG